VTIEIREARYDEPEVQKLVAEALGDLSQRYGGGSGDDTPVSADEFVPPHGGFFVAVSEDRLAGCAGWRAHGPDAELKRMFVTSSARGRGVARRLLAAVEESARADRRPRMILEAGNKQPEAITLYESCGYHRIEDFGFYKGYDGVVSYAKALGA
jgi:GNAT superfamily N-acetyltransferase